MCAVAITIHRIVIFIILLRLSSGSLLCASEIPTQNIICVTVFIIVLCCKGNIIAVIIIYAKFICTNYAVLPNKSCTVVIIICDHDILIPEIYSVFVYEPVTVIIFAVFYFSGPRCISVVIYSTNSRASIIIGVSERFPGINPYIL